MLIFHTTCMILCIIFLEVATICSSCTCEFILSTAEAVSCRGIFSLLQRKSTYISFSFTNCCCLSFLVMSSKEALSKAREVRNITPAKKMPWAYALINGSLLHRGLNISDIISMLHSHDEQMHIIHTRIRRFSVLGRSLQCSRI